MSSKKIAFLCDWGESSEGLLKRLVKQTPNDSGKWGHIEGVSRIEDADYYVVMDGFDINKVPDKSKLIYFQREPEAIYNWSGKGPYLNHDFPEEVFFVGTYDKFYNVVTWWINLPFEELKALEYPAKTKKISTITSGKMFIEEHVKRVRFLDEFVGEYPIDVYGRGIEDHLEKNVWDKDAFKGELDHKLDGLLDYEYTLVLENVTTPNTWSEKLADAYLCWSFPIFSGDTTLSNYFPEASFFQIDLNKPTDKEIGKAIEFINRPPSQYQIKALEEARNLVLNDYNIWPSIDKIIKEKE